MMMKVLEIITAALIVLKILHIDPVAGYSWGACLMPILMPIFVELFIKFLSWTQRK